jgi:apolipoprotein D and lipocalin family protein
MRHARRARRLVATLAVAGGLALATAGSAGAASTPPVVPVAHLDLTSYLGSWHQVAAIPAIYELPCAKDSTANYSLNTDGSVKVYNTCTTWINTTYSVTGKAVVRDATTDAQLEVSFLNLLGQQIFFNSVNYVVIALDPAYRYAVVASPDHSSAFVLSRAAALTSAQTATVQAALTKNGISPCALNTTPTTGGITTSHAFC